jgi:hypothetical protein
MLKSINKWVFVATGILFNISSAIITHYFIGINDQQLMQLEKKASEYDTQIQSQWRMKTEIDRKQDFLLLLLNQQNAENSQQTSDFIISQLNHSIDLLKINKQQLKPDSVMSFDTISNISEMIKQNIISRINDTYLEKLEIESKQAPLKERNSMLYSIAIFLQLTGLILVLAKDIGK